MAKPFIKWIGGKRQLVPELLKHIPQLEEIGTYYEPFIGGGALFFTLQEIYEAKMGKPLKATINDANPHLVGVYRQVRGNVRAVIDTLEGLDCSVGINGFKEAYSRIRTSFNEDTHNYVHPARRAGWFLAMNAWGFNGLCRYNHSGGFNVPCGKFSKTPVLLDKADNLYHVSDVLKDVLINQGDFAKSVVSAKKGDLIYFDPPYFPINATSDFTSYTKEGFDAKDQIRLHDLALLLVERGAWVILSNSDTPATRELYGHKRSASYFALHKVQARRAVNCNAAKRGKVGELIIVGKP